jgi:hypothetical protein
VNERLGSATVTAITGRAPVRSICTEQFWLGPFLSQFRKRAVMRQSRHLYPLKVAWMVNSDLRDPKQDSRLPQGGGGILVPGDNGENGEEEGQNKVTIHFITSIGSQPDVARKGTWGTGGCGNCTTALLCFALLRCCCTSFDSLSSPPSQLNSTLPTLGPSPRDPTSRRDCITKNADITSIPLLLWLHVPVHSQRVNQRHHASSAPQ